MMKTALLVFDAPFEPAGGYDFAAEFREPDWRCERAVCQALRRDGWEVSLLGINGRIEPLFERVRAVNPSVVFNLVEVFSGQSRLEKNVAWALETLGLPYTGASPAALLLCNDKALSREVLARHGIRVPRFQVFRNGGRSIRPGHLRYPLIVKPLREEASRGISRASVVHTEKALAERVRFIFNRHRMDAIAEEYIEGRELFMSILGARRLYALPLREIRFGRLPPGAPRVATYRAKWDERHRKKWGIENGAARGVSPALSRRTADICKLAYRALGLDGYARFDLRVTATGEVFVIEANANPSLGPDDELALSARRAGISYPELIRRITRLALARGR